MTIAIIVQSFLTIKHTQDEIYKVGDSVEDAQIIHVFFQIKLYLLDRKRTTRNTALSYLREDALANSL